MLEDLGGGLGVTDPVSGEKVVTLAASVNTVSTAQAVNVTVGDWSATRTSR